MQCVQRALGGASDTWTLDDLGQGSDAAAGSFFIQESSQGGGGGPVVMWAVAPARLRAWLRCGCRYVKLVYRPCYSTQAMGASICAVVPSPKVNAAFDDHEPGQVAGVRIR
jgi:hypothetical protein